MTDGGDLDYFRRQWSEELKSGRSKKAIESVTEKSQSSDGLDAGASGGVKTGVVPRPSTSSTSVTRADLDSTEETEGQSFESITKFESHNNVEISNSNEPSVSTKRESHDNANDDVRERFASPKAYRPFLSSLFGDARGGSRGLPGSDEVREEFLHSRNKRLKLSSPNVTEVNKSPKQPACDDNFLDIFLSDLEDINEIPFFETSLARELAINIFRHLEPLDLCRCCQVSRAWKSLAEDELLWSQICAQLDYQESAATMEKTNWKDIVKSHVLLERSLRNNWKMRYGEVTPLEYVSGGILCAATSWTDTLAAGYTSGTVSVWRDDENYSLVPSTTALAIDEHVALGTLTNMVTHVALNSHFIAAAYTQGNVDVWTCDGTTNVPVNTLRLSHPIHKLCSSQTQPLLVMAAENQLGTCHTKTGELVKTETDVRISDVCILPHSKHKNSELVAISMHDRVKLLEVGIADEGNPGRGKPSGEMTTIHDTLNHRVTCMDGSAERLAIGVHGEDSFVVKVYDVCSGREEIILAGHTWLVSTVNIADSPPFSLVTGSYDRKVCVYDTRLCDPVITLQGHTGAVHCVQMDDWKVVSGSEDGMVIAWDQRMATKLWEQHNRHPVGYLCFQEQILFTANIPSNKQPETDDFDSVYHRRYRGCLSLYDFSVDQTRNPSLPSNVRSTYDDPEGYNYNIGLAMPYSVT